MIDYKRSSVEVDEILNYLSKEYYIKIPEYIITYIKENKDLRYIWKYDKTKKLKDQDVSDDTIAILSFLNIEYLLNTKQKVFVEKLHLLNNPVTNYNNTYIDKEIFKKNFNKEIIETNQNTKYNTI